MKIFIRSILLYALSTLLCLSAFADPKLYSTVTPSSGTIDDTFTLSFTLEGAQSTSKPHISGGDDFEVKFAGTQSSTQIINGDVSQKLTFNYRLKPTKEGLLETPSGQVQVDGESLDARPLQVLINKLAPTRVKPAGNEEVFLEQSNDKKSVFLGEQIVNSLDFCYRVRIMEPKLSDMSFDGFWQQGMGENENLSRRIGGRDFQVLRIKHALYALRPGSIILGPRKILASVPEGTRRGASPFGSDPFDPDFFDSIFNGTSYKEQTFRSNEVEIEVKPLPPAPRNFKNWGLNSTVVGHTDLSVEYPGGDIAVGESKTIRYEITSLGNINAVNEIPIPQSENYRIYQETPESKPFQSAGSLVSKKILKVSLVAVKPGPLKIEPIVLSYFDPEEKSYKQAQSKEVTFNITGSAQNAPASVSAIDTNAQAPVASASPQQKKQTQPTKVETPTQTPSIPQYQEQGTLEKFSSQISLSLSLFVCAVVAAIVALLWGTAAFLGKGRPLRDSLSKVSSATSLEELNTAVRQCLAVMLAKDANSTLINQARSEELRKLLSEQISDQAKYLAVQSLLDDLEQSLYGARNSKDLEQLRERALSALKW